MVPVIDFIYNSLEDLSAMGSTCLAHNQSRLTSHTAQGLQQQGLTFKCLTKPKWLWHGYLINQLARQQKIMQLRFKYTSILFM